MFDSKIYYDGALIVGKVSGVVEPQSFINGIFWQVDSRNLGEVKAGFSLLYYDCDIESIEVSDEDIKTMAEINAGIGANTGKFRTALVISNPEVIRLAKLHQSLARKSGYEVELFNTLSEGFAWLGFDNPDPGIVKI